MNRIEHSDCMAFLATIPGASVDSCVTDPPYELGFMGKAWDKSGIANKVELWAQVLRVLKPGAHILAFSGTRTYHRMVCAIEDAGFEIRDQMAWVYGSGFPKSLDVGKAIDKAAGAEREVIGLDPQAAKRNKNSVKFDGVTMSAYDGIGPVPLTAPATEAAKRWDGWGTALNPAWEPIVVARKPLKGTVAQNVLAHGCGALNVDGCRIEASDKTPAPVGRFAGSTIGPTGLGGMRNDAADALGRWPANIIHDGSAEVLAMFPETTSGNVKPCPVAASEFQQFHSLQKTGVFNGDSGSAARFFYSAKASGDERDGNSHATVKPLALMRYLVRLVTPPGGTVLDHFAGSGSTLIAAKQEGFSFLGCDLEAEHVAIIRARLAKELL